MPTAAEFAQLSIWPHFTGFMSMMGSGAIIFEVLSNKEKRSQVMFRLLLAMSISDFNTSFWYFLSTWAVPSENTNLYQANGTDASCTAQGFFVQLGIATPLYNFALSFYYLLLIRYRLDETDMARKEKWFHVFPCTWALVTSFSALGLNLLNNANLWCWIAPYPLSCKGSYRNNGVNDCIRGNNAWIFRWVFFYAPLWAAIFFSMIAMFLTYDTVRKQEKKVSKYAFTTKKDKNRGSTAYFNSKSSAQSQGEDKDQDEAKNGEEGDKKEGDTSGDGEPREEFKENEKKSKLSFMKKKKSKKADKTEEDEERSRASYSKRVAKQALWYLSAFYLSWLPATLTRLIQTISGKTYFPDRKSVV